MIHSCSERKMMIWSLCLIISLYYSILGFSSPDTHLCRPDQRDALWELRSEFYVYGTHFHGLYKYEKTELWTNNTDCCSWDGISCDPKTGKVVELNLWGSSLNGPLRSNSSMFRLQDLQNLNLDENNFHGILPHSIGNLKNLRFLSIRRCGLYGKIPSSLGNLSYLTNLDLSDNDLTGELPDSMGSLHQLLEFQLGWNKISGNFPLMLLNLSELTTVYLSGNEFKGMLPSNMSSLSKLLCFDITSNSFFGSIPSSLFMMPSLISLYLGINDFSGPLEIGNISSSSKLENLSLNNNNFKGEIPRSISKLVGLQFLDLSFWNARKDMVDFSIFLHLKSLEKLYLSYLNTRSMIDLSFFTHLILLSELDLSGNNLNISATLHFPAPIQHLDLSTCNIAEFPKFIQNQTSLTYLHISENQIEGQVPEWLWKLPGLVEVNISQNFISGFEGSADVIQGSGLGSLDISSNTFLDLPLLPKNLVHLLGSDNRFTGEIPNTICELVSLDTLILSSNNFSGSIPRCFQNFNYTLSILHLQHNSLSGVIPEESISTDLISLDLGHNWLSGALPKSLMNCTQLEFLNVEDNKISDKFPFWMRLFTNLQILVLRSNEFHGPISSLRYSLSFAKLRIFDISDNCFSGVLPSDYFAGWSAFSSVVDVEDSFFYGGATGTGYYHQSVDLTNKGLEMVLVGSGFKLYKTIDVSANKFEGDIPESIGLLKELIVLNMSDNAFTGRIPPSLGNLTNLQSLDLSRNGLSGEIPSELGKLTFLEWMNFSHNRLEGPIPQSTQIQSQNSSSFAENPGLCGVPLTKTCGEATKKEEDKENEEKDQVLSWIAAAIGCVPGLFCGFTIGHFLTSYKRDWLLKIFNFFA